MVHEAHTGEKLFGTSAELYRANNNDATRPLNDDMRRQRSGGLLLSSEDSIAVSSTLTESVAANQSLDGQIMSLPLRTSSTSSSSNGNPRVVGFKEKGWVAMCEAVGMSLSSIDTMTTTATTTNRSGPKGNNKGKK